ncbi:MAG: PspA/IM30 family protein [Sneathiellales bacterium]|nr:PspA/IM30 family protein [Sneathiellales bacterium]
MSWNKVVTALKGLVAETGENIADKQALRIMDQELREATNDIAKAKQELTKIMAKRTGVERSISDLQSKITSHEDMAGQALDKGDEQLAADICERIASFESDLETEQSMLQSFSNSESSLKSNLKKAEARLKSLKQQQDILKATEAVQNAQGVVANRFSGSSSKMNSAMGSLERIKARQQERQDRFAAAEALAEEENGDDLDRRMKAAGIGEHTSKKEDILARIKAKK